MNAIVTSMIANLYAEPNGTSELIDELLYGMPVQIMEELDDYWVRIQTTYQYEGYCRKVNLLLDNVKTSAWCLEASYVIRQSFADILQHPRIQSSKLMTLVRGSIVRYLQEEELDSEWAVIQLATGERGYLRKKWLSEKLRTTACQNKIFGKTWCKRHLVI